ncbi:tRNA pseudouridine synthase 1 [Tolypocladium capitatum]|uniref:tRNA pseudouridine synthase 1 n=1 Tax=Tolypocladium capitatum TaxID=45235 RepID=A0A2K3QQB4_9HYPO|nr:tRNA pseudouridine synthase 1 [Tolypocladium capitatum]
MAAGDEPCVENGAPAEQRSAAPSGSKPDPALTSQRSAADGGVDKDVEHDDDKHDDGKGGAKKRGDTGRGEWRGEQKKANKRKKQDDWREFKRRKVNGKGESVEEGSKNNPFSKDEIAAEERRPKRKVAVMIGYAGTGYKGMQVNGDEPTIERDLFQAFIEAKAISKANADDPRKSSLARCARTDKGVHAAGNVISLKLIIEEEGIVDRINALLPEQIRVWGIQRTNNSFNCYQYCDSRWYEYLMPSYCLLPPHPQTFLGRKVAELTREYGAEEVLKARMADVKDFWTDVEEREVKPILAALDAEVRAAVLERVHVADVEEPETDKAGASEAKDEPATAPKTEPAHGATGTEANGQGAKATLASVRPKHRELGPVDFALRDIKAAYVAAKRRYRVGTERLQRLQAALDKFVGTNNFHNYTVQKPFADASAKRHIKSFVVNPQPIIIGDTEWLSLKVHGQSFMMHQIRKMVGMVSLAVRCGTDLDMIEQSYQNRKIAIPKAPGLGLLLERPVFENYNRRATDSLGRREIDFDGYDEELQAFKDKHIYTRIFDVEEKENTFHAFFNQIDQFRSNHFLWLTAGGLAVAEILKSAGGKVQEDVDKELGDEDEDPEGGEG